MKAPPVDLIYRLLVRHPNTKCLLIHGGTTDLLALSDIVRSLPNVLLDLSMTLLRYRGSSIDLDLHYVLSRLDQKCVVGSDFPEHLPDEAKRRVLELMNGCPSEKLASISSLFSNNFCPF